MVQNLYKSVLGLCLILGVAFGLNAQNQETINQIEQDVVAAQQYASENELSQAISYFEKAAYSYWQLDMLPQAAEQFENGLKCADELGNKNAQHIFNNSLGSIYLKMGVLDKALTAFQNSTQIAQDLGRKYEVTGSYLNQANIYNQQNQSAKALNALNKAHEIAKELQDLKLLRNIYSAYVEAYKKDGDVDQSTWYFDQMSAINKKIQQQEQKEIESEVRQIVAEATSRVKSVEAEKQATEIELQQKGEELTQKQQILEETEKESTERLMRISLLDQEMELKKKELQVQNQRRKFYIASIILILAFSGYLLYSILQKRKANRLLSQKNIEITEQNHEIQLQAEQLRNLNNLKDKLFSIIAHDLRSPLGSLVSMLNLNRQGYLSQEEFQEIINDLSKNVAYTSELLENLLNWAQSQMQGLQVIAKPIELKPVVQTKIDLYTEQAQKKGIELRNLIEESVEVYADYSMVELTLRNLIGNAIKFCNPGDSITIMASDQNDHVLVSVSDTGIGISQDKVKRLFGNEVVTTRGTADEKGSGLGLMLCKEFITLNNGKIWVKSIEGVGTDFFFTLPKVS